MRHQSFVLSVILRGDLIEAIILEFFFVFLFVDLIRLTLVSFSMEVILHCIQITYLEHVLDY